MMDAIIIINIIRDGIASGTMQINFGAAFAAWGVMVFKRIMQHCKESDAVTGTNTRAEIAAILFDFLVSWYRDNMPEFYRHFPKSYEAAKKCDFDALKKEGHTSAAADIKKAMKFLDIASPEKFAEFAEIKKSIETEIEPTAANTGNIADAMNRKTRTAAKNEAYVKHMNINNFDVPFTVCVGHRVEIPATSTAPGYTAYIEYNAATRKYEATEKCSGIMLTSNKNRAALVREISAPDFVARVDKAMQSPRIRAAIDEIAAFVAGNRADIAEKCKECSRDKNGNIMPEIAQFFATVYPPKSAETVKPWYLRDDANADCMVWGDYTAPEMPETIEPETETADTCQNAEIIDDIAANIAAIDVYAIAWREMERARRSYTPPKPSRREYYIKQTAGIFAGKYKIVKRGA